MNKTALLKTLKEAGRLAFFAALTVLVGYAGNKLAGLNPDSLYYLSGTVLLKLVDKYIHENENISLSGVAPF